jgi:hypothetical protein
VAVRDASGDIVVRLVRSEFANEATISGAMAFRVNNSTDNYIRFCSDTPAIRTFLNVPTRTGGEATGTWAISITGNANTATLASTATTFSTNRTNYKGVTDDAVAGQLMWKEYGNNHTIFDASDSTSPSGGAVNNTNAAVPWAGTYPTLMGWNGASTYGVRVDSARVSDNTSGNAATVTNGVYTTGDQTIGGNKTFSGTNTVIPRLFLQRVSNTNSGISFYATNYTSWCMYMSPAGATSTGPTGNITTPSGNLVTSWGLRSFIENAGGYGWTFESGAGSTGQPSVVAEIRASDGAARFNGSLTVGGTVTELSSIAYKENVSPIDSALDKVLQLMGVTYDRKDGSSKNEAGLIAEDVAKVLPNIVSDKEGKPEGIQYTKLTAYLIECIKELNAKIERLEGKQ